MNINIYKRIKSSSVNSYFHFTRTDIFRTFVEDKIKNMKTGMARFDTRLSEAQKEYFEYAAILGGYRTLTEFVIVSVQNKADEIVEKHKSILASKQDQEVFFKAIMDSPAPGKKLKVAARKYNKLTKQ